MARLITSAAGTAANTDPVLNPSVIIYNPDPVFQMNTSLNTLYVWADTWGGASVQLFVSPQLSLSPTTPVWFPLRDKFTNSNIILTANDYATFQIRWAALKVIVTGATSTTANLNASILYPPS